MTVPLTPRPLAASVDELLADATRREPWSPSETRSGTGFERVWIDGEALLVKYLHLDEDFPMRVSGDIGCRSARAFAAGLYDLVPERIEHGIVGMATGHGRNGWGAAILMHDVGAGLSSTGGRPFSDEEHDGFIGAMAAMCAATMGFEDGLDLLRYEQRWEFFGPAMVEAERALGWPERVPQIVGEGWERFAERVPAAVAGPVLELRRDVGPLATALQATPACFLHGDWKNGNLGRAADGRTILIDWVYLGAGPPCHELGWYLALNRELIPPGRTKEDVIAEFERALVAAGVDTAGWFDRQLRLALLGSLVQFGWEKAFGDDAELAWWCDRATDGLPLL